VTTIWRDIVPSLSPHRTMPFAVNRLQVNSIWHGTSRTRVFPIHKAKRDDWKGRNVSWGRWGLVCSCFWRLPVCRQQRGTNRTEVFVAWDVKSLGNIFRSCRGKCCCHLQVDKQAAHLTLYLLTWRILWAPNNASKGQTGFNLAFKRLNLLCLYWDNLDQGRDLSRWLRNKSRQQCQWRRNECY